MKAEIKSVRKIIEIFLCIFTYILKLDIFSIYLNFDDIFGGVMLKAKQQNVQPKLNFKYRNMHVHKI